MACCSRIVTNEKNRFKFDAYAVNKLPIIAP